MAAGVARASAVTTHHQAGYVHANDLRPGGRAHLTSHNLHSNVDYSTNWAGWVDYNSTFSSVSTTFTQPALDCSSGDTTYSSFWVGLDGYNSNSVEQTGTEADCSGGSPSYSAWYEMYPAYPVTYSDTVSPGDVLTSSVSYSNGQYLLTLSDSTQGWTESTTQAGSYSNASAEVIAEAPYSGGVLPLADFGTVNFSNSTADGSPLSAYTTDQLDMQSSSGTLEATTSSLDSSGEAFSVAWNSE
jgi:hypothetical protein